jgi:hypothetical protein
MDESLNPSKLLFVRKELESQTVRELQKLLDAPGDLGLGSANISVLLLLLHEARSKDDKAFFIRLFLPWISVQQSVRVQRDRVLDEFARIQDFDAGSRQASGCVPPYSLASPRRGLIEATQATGAVPAGIGFPRSIDRGLIEASAFMPFLIGYCLGCSKNGSCN